ncbi:gamma-glutamylcyclotransferase family protein [Sphingomonas sp. S2-65]|uniref:gamma-glutamylcyclotransferase family protein n=1 Tax=Sphingomonas sp. S2-65 TaxID=2903960 RepID=UPI001F3F0405|nr:gamma-glutamylcyclotransferase family protein [Sphingomonas sp. S2-65]UYY59594.1 gamma-glutamylcyclotransferase [Sphingomonas sp. S2-65]
MRLAHWLFSYGTLRQTEVQRELFGRVLESEADVLPGFRSEMLQITDPDVLALSGLAQHPVLRRGSPSDLVSGAALRVTDEDLARADTYEVADYARIAVTLGSGRRAFVYVHRDDAP